MLQALFAAVDPLVALRKFTRFAALPQTAPPAQHFVALEDWLNDGVPLGAAGGARMSRRLVRRRHARRAANGASPAGRSCRGA